MLEPDNDAVLTQFNRLMEELLRGNLKRSRFRPWEIEILVDMVSGNPPGIPPSAEVLRGYQNAVQRRIEQGARVPLKLSEYLESRGGSHQFNPSNVEHAAGAHG